MVLHNLAEELGLLDHVVREQVECISFWDTTQELLNIVDGVPFKLDNIEVLRSSYFHQDLQEKPEILLDNVTST